MDFSKFDVRQYPTVSVQEGYREWAHTYEKTHNSFYSCNKCCGELVSKEASTIKCCQANHNRFIPFEIAARQSFQM